MSVDSTQLDRSRLEAKDRDELTTIVSALGGKPGRAKKADLVDMIIELANGGGTEAPARAAAPRRRSRAGADPAEVAPAEVAPADEPSAPAAAPMVTAAPAPVPAPAADPAPRLFATPSAPPQATEPAGRAERPAGPPQPRAAAPAPVPAPATNGHSATGTATAPSTTASPSEAAAAATDAPATDAPGTDAQASGGERRRPPRFVGWAGDQSGAPAPTEDPEGDRATSADADEAGDTAAVGAPAREGERTEGDDDRRFDGEGGSRRRRRRGRDRNRDRPDGERGERPERGDRPERGERAERGDREDRGDRSERGDRGYDTEPVAVAGYLDLRDEGYGFLRIHGFLPSREDAYVSKGQVRQFSLRRGDRITGAFRPAGRNEKNPALLRVDTVNGRPADEAANRPRFEDLTPLFPDETLRMESGDDPLNMTARIIDLVSPIGKGQRGMIVSPPKAGKTTVMKQIARSIEQNNPEVHLIVLLVDERPEEVTDMKRWLHRGEVIASTFDRPSDEHCAAAELSVERAKRLVEYGKDVVIILDGITRLARAYNQSLPATGRLMSGGIDAAALYPPKRFFGAARNVEEGGSLTVLATALVETGSRMDEVIFEEFKGTGNMELRLDRRIAERRIYPAIDVGQSSTRHEELLFERKQLQQVYKLRRVLSGLQQDGEGGGGAALELLIDRLKTFKTNDEFLAEVAKGPNLS